MSSGELESGQVETGVWKSGKLCASNSWRKSLKKPVSVVPLVVG